MKPETKLDAVLKALDNQELYPEDYEHIKSKLRIDISDKELGLILNKLVDDGYVIKQYSTKEGQPTNDKYFQITYQGLLFYQRGGYETESKTLTRNHVWIVAKTIVATLNAIGLLAIAIWSVMVSKQSNNKDLEIQRLKIEIQALEGEKEIKNGTQQETTTGKVKIKLAIPKTPKCPASGSDRVIHFVTPHTKPSPAGADDISTRSSPGSGHVPGIRSA